ncbi:GNAT family N-acetyltransferase [Marisediminicola senii]|uniref:GNAT family N-acetyltransferase n=1 Tax=Marisediminicola senii TaxID=2711233 RepID=UPI0013EC705B|nr:GNAT family protein [Marisediminicola senii]
MTATRPDPAETMTGRFIRLEPLTRERLPELFSAIGHPIVFAGGYGGGPAGYRDTEAGFIDWAETYYSWNAGNVYAVIVVGGPHDERLVGTTTLGDFEPQFEATHIGWTAYDPRVWGTAVNAEAKRLLLTSAFDHGFGRVKIQADALNERSRAAIHRIGATFEGVLRRDRPRADGTWRDSAVFSVIIDDWPKVRDILDGRLDPHSGRPVLFRSWPNEAPTVPPLPRAQR